MKNKLKKVSIAYLQSKRGQKGRRGSRHLNDMCVFAAKEKSKNIEHQNKFLNKNKRISAEFVFES